jgi:hypothetical protein
VDRRVDHRSVGRKRRVPVDRARDPQPQLVVELRHGQHLDLVVHLLHVGSFATRLAMSSRLVRHRHLAGQRHHAVVDLGVDAVEDRVMRIRQHLLLHVAKRLQVPLSPPANAGALRHEHAAAAARNLANMSSSPLQHSTSRSRWWMGVRAELLTTHRES